MYVWQSWCIQESVVVIALVSRTRSTGKIGARGRDSQARRTYGRMLVAEPQWSARLRAVNTSSAKKHYFHHHPPLPLLALSRSCLSRNIVYCISVSSFRSVFFLLSCSPAYPFVFYRCSWASKYYLLFLHPRSKISISFVSFARNQLVSQIKQPTFEAPALIRLCFCNARECLCAAQQWIVFRQSVLHMVLCNFVENLVFNPQNFIPFLSNIYFRHFCKVALPFFRFVIVNVLRRFSFSFYLRSLNFSPKSWPSVS